MAKNPLGSGSKAASFKSGIRARDWARMAREKGYTKHAEAWEQADAAGWDDLHYDPHWNPETKQSEPPVILRLR